ncbi:MAG TPA: metallopeptidase TldD-related protein [Burkholderiaceae bacterium]|nr:metallopeptidase TldD-related protein [Burkholderiaceae bacterium]
MQDLFFGLVERAIGALRGREFLLANFAGEISDFVRFNHTRVRQAMTIQQAHLALTLIDANRHASIKFTLTADPTTDHAAVDQALAQLRADLPTLPADPYLLYSTAVNSSEVVRAGRLPQGGEAIETIIDSAQGADLVGILGSGPVYRGFANSAGQRNWHAVDCFNFEWSLYHAQDKAVKSAYAGTDWSATDARRRVDAARERLAYLGRPPMTMPPGVCRAYLAPAAVDELLWMLNWGGVSAKAQRTKQSPIQRLVENDRHLSDRVHLRENTLDGLAPAFDAAGFVKPAAVPLITGGRHAGSLVSPRTAREYGLDANGADDDETMQSMELAAGNLAQADALGALDQGVYVGNVWYLNYSDRPNGRITGMTRFGTFWVENGRIVAPLTVMRFDDSLFRMLGDHLVDFTREREWIVNSGTYGQRSIETSRVPGTLLSGLNFTL